jgi:hypothetical protein
VCFTASFPSRDKFTTTCFTIEKFIIQMGSELLGHPLLIELNDRFSNTNLDLVKILAVMYPESEQFLEFKSLCSLADHLNCDLNQLQNELNVIKPIIKDEKLKSTIELYEKLRPYKEAFQTVMSMITEAFAITCFFNNLRTQF